VADTLWLAPAERAALVELASGSVTQPTDTGSPAAVAPRSAGLVRLPVPPKALIGREADETVFVIIDNPTNALVGNSVGELTIDSDDRIVIPLT
jgi:hypothetical protein